MKKLFAFWPMLFLFFCLGRVPVAHCSEPKVSVMDVSGDWEAVGDLPKQALLISLQGIVNKNGPYIYLFRNDQSYPDLKGVLDFYKNRYHIKADTLQTVEAALAKYHSYLKGYVVWDPTVIHSLMVSFTVAGLQEALVITSAQIPLVEKWGLKPVADFRDKFIGRTDAELFKWAYDEYWPKCSKDYLVYLGGQCKGRNGNPGMWPGIADFGIVHQCFFTDLSTSPMDQDEYPLADKIMSEMKPYGYVYGWHSCKDMEPEYLTMISRHALVVAEGLEGLPNMSFHGKMTLSPDFKFKQKAKSNLQIKAEDKVYLTLIQSDGMGIGSWMRPGRGEIPYGWEANEEWLGVAPVLLQYFYESATANDQFIGSLSGPGYFYPKVFPKDKLAGALRIEDGLMRKLDLHVFGIMDFSEGDRNVGNVDLPKYIVDAYYENMPFAMGFINGYGPGNTYDFRNGRPLISYNYYVTAEKPVEEVAEDLRELAAIDPKRPYFLPVHVRESNDVSRMKKIFDLLGPDFKLVLPEEFMILAASRPTMTTRYLDYHPDFSGHWKLDVPASQNIFASSYDLDIDQRGNALYLTTTARYERFIHHRELRTSKIMTIGGPPVVSQEEKTKRMGYLAARTDSVATRALWAEDGKTLILLTDTNLQTSQGLFSITSRAEHKLSDDGMTLTVTERRLSRKSDSPVAVFVYKRVL